MKWEMEISSPSSYISSNSSWLIEESFKSTIWTPAENKLFENALAKFDNDTPDRWQRVAEMVPGKTVADVMRQYKELEDDVSSIEAGLIPIPGYSNITSPFTLEWGNSHGFDGFKPPYGAGGKRSSAAAARLPEQERKKGVPWTEEEHKLFLLGLKKYGKGDWRNISRNFVITRTPTQVASHAQKYFIRQLSGGKDKRRASIHDITTVNLNDNNHTPLSDNKRTPSPEQSNVLSQQHLSSSPMCRTSFQWNQPNNGTAAMAFNQTHGNLFVSPRYGVNAYELKMQGQNFQIGGLHESYSAPQSMVFQMQSALHYPRG